MQRWCLPSLSILGEDEEPDKPVGNLTSAKQGCLGAYRSSLEWA